MKTIGIEAQRLFRRRKHGMDIVALETIRRLGKMDSPFRFKIFVRPDEDSSCLEETPRLKIIPLKAASYPTWEQRKLANAAREHKIDLLHCTSNTAPIFSPVPTVITLHDVIFLERTSLDMPGARMYQQFGNLYRKWIVPPAVRNADRIITVSEFEKTRIRQMLGLPGDRIQVIYNAVGDLFKSHRRGERVVAVRNKYSLPNKYLFFLGNTDPKKNLTNVLSAYLAYYKLDPNPQPLVIADLSQHQLSASLARLGHPENHPGIHLPGYIGQSDLPSVYEGASLFLYPSLRESFGIPQLEAMACGTPVITSSVSAMPEIAGSAALLVDPTQPDSILEAMLTILRNPLETARLRREGFKRVEDFSWDTAASELLKVYTQSLGEKHPGSSISRSITPVRRNETILAA